MSRTLSLTFPSRPEILTSAKTMGAIKHNVIDRNAVLIEPENVRIKYRMAILFVDCQLQLYRHLLELARQDFRIRYTMTRNFCVTIENFIILALSKRSIAPESTINGLIRAMLS